MRNRPISGATLGLALLLVVVPVGCRSGPDAGGAGRPRVGPAGRRPPQPLPTPLRAIWVARYHYRTPDDIRRIMARSAALGANTVLWQVRGEGTVAYPSRLEPWSREFDFRDPGYDPLALAVSEAHRRGLRIEAWVNVMPGWRGRTPPPVPSQLYHAHPDWFVTDAWGRRQPLGDFYVILNPCRPEVRRHIARVVAEIATNYDVDGIHLDYVRFAWDGTPNARARFPRDAQTLALYRRETGRTPDEDPAAWDAWRAAQVTRTVAEIRQAVRRTRPGATLSAAVWGDLDQGYREYLQNGPAWLRAGLVDALLPMAYTDNPAEFTASIEAYRAAAPGRRVVPGVGVYKLDSAAGLATQLAECERWGGDWALFSYDALFPTGRDPNAFDPVQGLRRRVVAATARDRRYRPVD